MSNKRRDKSTPEVNQSNKEAEELEEEIHSTITDVETRITLYISQHKPKLLDKHITEGVFSPNMFSCCNSKTGGMTPLHMAVINAKTPAGLKVLSVLMKHKVDPDIVEKNAGYTPFAMGVIQDNLEACKILCEEGNADPTIVSKFGQSSIDLAIQTDKSNELIAYIKEKLLSNKRMSQQQQQQEQEQEQEKMKNNNSSSAASAASSSNSNVTYAQQMFKNEPLEGQTTSHFSNPHLLLAGSSSLSVGPESQTVLVGTNNNNNNPHHEKLSPSPMQTAAKKPSSLINPNMFLAAICQGNVTSLDQYGDLVDAEFLDQKVASSGGLTFIHLAASGNKVNAVEWLLNHGASINNLGPRGEHAAHTAIVSGSFDTAQLLIAKRVDLTLKAYSNQQTPYALAKDAFNGSDTAALILKTLSQNVISHPSEVPGYLLELIKTQNVRMIRLLFDCQVIDKDLLTCGKNHLYFLHFAAELGRCDSLRELLEITSTPDLVNHLNMTCLHVALITIRKRKEAEQMGLLADNNKNKFSSSSSTSNDSGAASSSSPIGDSKQQQQKKLHFAEKKDLMNIVQIMLDHYCSLEIRSSEGFTATEEAIRTRDTEVITMVEKGWKKFLAGKSGGSSLSGNSSSSQNSQNMLSAMNPFGSSTSNDNSNNNNNPSFENSNSNNSGSGMFATATSNLIGGLAPPQSGMTVAQSSMLQNFQVAQMEIDCPFLARFPRQFVFHSDDIEIGSFLASGGGGSVYVGKIKSIDKVCAMKVMKDPEAIREAVAEAELALHLHHRNIVSCLGVSYAKSGLSGLKQIDLILLMELAEGTLSSLLSSGAGVSQFSWSVALDYAKQLAESVAYLHSKRIIHRDIKPQQILVFGPNKSVIKLSDFGLSKRITTEKSHTDVTQAGAGTLRYLCKEGLTETKIRPTHDVYSYGASIFWFVCGMEPFKNCSIAEMMTKNLIDSVVPREGCPEELLKTCLACLAPNPQDRPKTGKQILQMLLGEDESMPSFESNSIMSDRTNSDNNENEYSQADQTEQIQMFDDDDWD